MQNLKTYYVSSLEELPHISKPVMKKLKSINQQCFENKFTQYSKKKKNQIKLNETTHR